MIYTFYSYKGGVGRTHLLANIAAYLCYYKKRKILLIDWDLEAPGLHYYFGKKDEDLQNTKGLIDLCEKYILQVNTATEQNPLQEKDLFFPNEEYIYNLIKNEHRGQIDILPATQYIENYHAHINQFDWIDFHDIQKGSIYLTWLKDKLKWEYDYVFIDSRTGQNDYSGICNVLMPDMNILVVAPNTQNFEGAKKMAERIVNSKYVKDEKRKPYILPILSRLEEANMERSEMWKNKFIDTFHSYMPLIDKDLEKFSKEVTDVILDCTYQIYNIHFAFGEDIYFNQEAPELRESHILKNIENISLLFIEELNETGKISLNKVVGDKMKLVYMKMIKENPNDFEAWNGLGIIYAKEKNSQTAIMAFKKATELKDYYGFWYNLGRVYDEDLHQHEDAVKAFLSSVKNNVNFDEGWYSLGISYSNLEKYEDAIKAYEKTLEIKKTKYEAWNNLGNIYAKQEKYEKSIQCYKYSLEIKNDFYMSWCNLGNVYNNLEEYSKSIQSFEKALSINPNLVETWNNLGFSYIKQKNYPKAKECLIKSLTIKSDNEHSLFNLSCVYSLEKNKEKALEYLQKAIILNPDKWKQKAQTDPDFEWLWQDKDFLALVK